MAKRERLEIIRDILRIIRDNHSIKLTPLLRKSNLSSSRFSEYFNELLEKDFIKKSLDKNEKKQIMLTEKGARYLEKYNVILRFIDEFEL